MNKAADLYSTSDNASLASIDGWSLPFVREVPSSDPDEASAVCWWWVRRTGDDGMDEALGLGLAEAALRRACKDGPDFLKFVLEDMVRAGQWGAVEQAFVDCVMERLRGPG